ncbi:hypothetical protein [Maricaulis sp.]|uniref:hypothetical protein n=1 Tax=Maricaulis sp. TaxID=1486257 RepID=UPI003A91638F
MSGETPDETPAPKSKSVMDRVMLGVIALMCLLFGLPMIYSSGTVIGAMFAGAMPSLWALALMPIALGLLYAGVRLGIAAVMPNKRAS